MRKIFLSLYLCLFITALSEAQPSKGWSIGVNPLSLAESQLSLGPCVSYRVNTRIGLWAEASCIFANSYMPADWKNMKGIRFIFQPRYFAGRRKQLFFAPELRLKSYSFSDRLGFINDPQHDTLNNFGFKENQFLAGGAFVVGQQIFLSKKKKTFLELTFGLGAKSRRIRYHNVPAGYKPFLFRPVDGGLSPNYEYETNGTVYVPMSCRFVWKLK